MSESQAMRVLCLGGGGTRAAFQVPIIERLLAEQSYDMILGISAGAINGALAAQGDLEELRSGWERAFVGRSMRGIPGFVALSRRPWISIYTLAPLRRRLEGLLSLDRLKVPFGCGVVVRETYKHEVLLSDDMKNDTQYCHAVVASCTIAGLMEPIALRDTKRRWTLADGGHRHNIPPVPVHHVADVTHLDAVFCSPLEYEFAEARPGLQHSIAWIFESGLEAAKGLDLERLKGLADDGVEVRVFAPKKRTGGLLDARPETLRARFDAAAEALEAPVIF